MENITPPELATHIAKRITALRLQKTWTRQVLAKKAQVNVHTLKHFERTGQISLERLISIAYALECESEMFRLFKPRQRVDINNWEIPNGHQRQRGSRLVKCDMSSDIAQD